LVQLVLLEQKRDALNKYLNDLTAQKNQAAKAEKEQRYIDLIVTR
jgi:hypothetical protein